MCVRLYPDIIVAAEINNERRFAQMLRRQEGSDKRVSEVNITIDGCLEHQKVYKHIGIRNVFVGFEGKEWDRWDYEVYLSRFPQYFKPVGGGKYHVDLAALAGDVDDEDIPLEICDKLFVLGTYPRRAMKTLGLYSYE